MRRILCLHMPHLPTERVRRDSTWAAERGRPLVLIRPVGASQVVKRVCPRARQRGLRAGLSLGEAQAIAPDLAAALHEPRRDRAALERLAGWALRFSPLVEPIEPDVLMIDITGCQRLFGGEENIAGQAVAGLARQGFYARGAVADTIGAANALAVAGSEPLCIVPVGQASAWLTPLPAAALRIETQSAEQLESLGVRSIGDLLMLPRASLAARFGAGLVLRLQQALGEVFEGVTPFVPEQMPRARQIFETPIRDARSIWSTLNTLLDEVFEQMLRRGLALRRLEGVFYYDSGATRPEESACPRVISVGLARASRERRHVAELLHQRLEQVDLTPGVIGLRLIARETSHWLGGQGELFEPREPGNDEALGCLIDRLAGRLGHQALVRPRLLDDHQPEMACRDVPVVEAGCDPEMPLCGLDEQADQRATRAAAARVRPLRLLSRPVLVRAIALVPDGPPTWFAYRGREYVVTQTQGPERLETAWWRGPDVRRDYFRVTVESGEQFWLFRDRGEQGWYLHGVFA